MQYRRNHYVPVWYQRRFLLPEQNEIHYLDLKPGGYRDGRGRYRSYNGRHRWGPRRCFLQRDLYTSFLGGQPETLIEEWFFGEIDRGGKEAVETLTEFSWVETEWPKLPQEQFHRLLLYMVTQRMRTPKGLGWLAEQARTDDKDALLNLMIQLRLLYNAVWAESVWLIADAKQSETKFIITDHPVTIYNRACGPRSRHCRGFNDPDPLFHASQTIFPLSLEKILILSNLSWVRNPYQDEMELRPNPALNRSGVFKLMEVQTDRHMTEQEVRAVNFILKSRAHQFIGAAREEWLHPEEHIPKSDWPTLGHGYLLMPDPRPIHMGGTVYRAYESGAVHASDEYGRTPGQRDFERNSDDELERAALYRFKGEFSRLFGPVRRGRLPDMGPVNEERVSEDMHAFHLEQEEPNRRLMKKLGSRR